MRTDLLIYGVNYAPELTGVGRYTGELACAMAERGYTVNVVTTPPHYPGWHARAPYSAWRYMSEDRHGIHVNRCPIMLYRAGRGIWRLLAPLSFALTSAPVFIARALKTRPRVILCVEPTLFVAPLAILMARLLRARTVLHVQDLEVDAAFAVGHLPASGPLQRLAAWFEQSVLHRFDEVVTISERMAQRLQAKGVQPTQLTVIRNWVDTTRIFPTSGANAYRKLLGVRATDFVVLYAGQIGAKQALHVLMAAAEMLKAHRDIHFVIAGEGPFKRVLVDQSGGRSNIHFLDLQPEERLNELLNLADCHVLPQDPVVSDLVLPSKLGGMLASGRRIIAMAEPASEVGRFLEGAARLVAPGDAEALATALLEAKDSADHDPNPALAKAVALSAAAAFQDFEAALLRPEPRKVA